MKREYSTPIIEKISFDYKIQTATSNCFESVMNQRVGGGNAYNTECVDGTPIGMGWTKDQTIVP